jgi:hypothetical protein
MANYVLVVDLGDAAVAEQYMALNCLMYELGFALRSPETLQPAQFSVISALSTLRCHPSRDHRQDSRPEWSRFSFSVGLSHPLQCAGLSRRSLSPYSPHGVLR